MFTIHLNIYFKVRTLIDKEHNALCLKKPLGSEF